MGIFLFLTACLLAFTPPLYSQIISNDSLPWHSLSTVVVTADRFQNKILTSTASISTVTPSELETFPLRSLPEMLSIIPGITVSDKSGLGFAPVIGMRGFYGGGEAEYALVLLDGVQINDLETGLINWSSLNISNIENVEIVRGGNSALYGDAAIGGVINITTRKQSKSFYARTGSFDSYGAGINYSFQVNNNPLNFYLSGDKSGGFRNNSDWSGLNFGGNYFIGLNKSSYLKFSTNNQLTDAKIPGPVPESRLNLSDDYSLPLFRSDRNKESRFSFIAEYLRTLSASESITLQLGYKNKYSRNINTFTNSVPIVDPENFNPTGIYDTSLFGDTKRRDLAVNEIRFSGNYFSDLSIIKTRFTSGADGNFGFYSSSHFNVFNGFLEDYQRSFSEASDMITDAKGNRQDYAVYLNSEVSPSGKLRFNFGLRFDHIADNYESSLPDSSISIASSALSPKAGLNFLIAESDRYSGSVYISYNRSFKAPTADQLMNLNRLDFGVFIPAGENRFLFFPFQAAPFANSALKPQKSTSFETGSYNSLRISDDIFSELFAAVYQSDVTDEIDFDLSTFRYGNIDKTKHRGLESGLKLGYKNHFAGFLNYTVSEVKFLSGSYKDNYVKGVPRNILSAGVTLANISGFYSGIIFSSYSSTFLDDENTQRLNDFSITDLRAGYKSGIFDLQLDVKNVFDKTYSSTGYLLNGIKYLYPAAGRTFYGRLSVTIK